MFCSTKSMRADGGYEVIKKAIEKLGLRHKEHIAAYGEGNERRLTGKHETADINSFLWVRIITSLLAPYKFVLYVHISSAVCVDATTDNALCTGSGEPWSIRQGWAGDREEWERIL